MLRRAPLKNRSHVLGDKLFENRVASYFSVVKGVSGVDAVDARRGRRLGGGEGGGLVRSIFLPFFRPTEEGGLRLRQKRGKQLPIAPSEPHPLFWGDKLLEN